MTGAWRLPARNGLPAALTGGTLHPPAPAVCLLDGLPPGRHPRQGRSASSASLRDRLRRPLTRPSSSRPGETRSPGAGEEQRPSSSQHEEAGMRQFEQDWLELGSRVARSLHYQARRWQREARRWWTP
jgi:hypothetical protein